MILDYRYIVHLHMKGPRSILVWCQNLAPLNCNSVFNITVVFRILRYTGNYKKETQTIQEEQCLLSTQGSWVCVFLSMRSKDFWWLLISVPARAFDFHEQPLDGLSYMYHVYAMLNHLFIHLIHKRFDSGGSIWLCVKTCGAVTLLISDIHKRSQFHQF